MRVLMFGWEFPPFKAGGLATATHGLVKGLTARGVDVTLVVPFPVDGSAIDGLRLVTAAGVREHVQVHRVPSPAMPYAGAAEYAAGRRLEAIQDTTGSSVYGADLFSEVERFAAVAGEIARSEPHDVIDAHDWITFAAALAAQRISGKPLVAHIHATERDRTGGPGDPWIFAREQLGMLAATRVISNSQTLKDQVVADYQVADEKVSVVHWGIEPSVATVVADPPSPFTHTGPTVLFLGRVTRQKGPGYFIDVADRVSRILPDARFIMAGDGDLLPQMVERVADLGLEDRVHFMGALQGAEVDRAFRLADVCVMPSVSEPFGLVALESLRNGTPCIVPRESGVAEVLRHAFKVDFWDVDEMTNKIVALARFPELHEELRERGRREVLSSRFSLDEPARRTEDVYRQAIHAHGDASHA